MHYFVCVCGWIHRLIRNDGFLVKFVPQFVLIMMRTTPVYMCSLRIIPELEVDSDISLKCN